MVCQCHWQNRSIMENTKYMLLYACIDVLLLHSYIFSKTDDDSDDKTHILKKRNSKTDWFIPLLLPPSIFNIFALPPKSLLTMETRERRERWCDGAYALSLCFIDEWAEQSAWLSISITHLKEWVMMHNCRCAWIELKNFHMFYFSLYKCRYIYIYIRKTYTSIQFKKKKA
jgi:hypothetical protein